MKTFKVLTTYMEELESLLASANTGEDVYNKVVNAPFSAKSKGIPLGLGVVVLLLVNNETTTIDRIALSDTEPARGAVEYSVKPFHDIKIPKNHQKNLIARAIRSGHHQMATDWRYLFVPALTAQEARFNQAGAGVATSIVYPLVDTLDGGALIYSYFIPHDQISDQHHQFMSRYSELVARHLRP